MNDNLKTRLRNTIIKALNKDIPADSIIGKDMIAELGMSSVDALEVLIRVEGEFNIQIDDNDLSQELVASLDNLEKYVQSKIGV